MTEDATNRTYYKRAKGTTVQPLDTLMPGEHLLVSTEARRYQLTGLARDVIVSLQEEPLDFLQLGGILSERGVPYTTARLMDVLHSLEKFVIVSTNQPPILENQKKRRAASHYLTLKIPLFSATRISPLTRRLSVLFQEKWMLWLVPTLLTSQISFCWIYKGRLLPLIQRLEPGEVVLLIAGNYLALLLHELGHASACSAKGVPHGPIGFCIYLIYPAFYADVSAIWALPRAQRATVDAGGIYMSLLCASLYSTIFLLTRSPVSAILTLLCDITVLFNLNPFIRMDGYWLISDWMGVQNLMIINREVTWWALRRLVGRRVERPAVLSSKYGFRSVFVPYYCLFLIFSAYVMLQMAIHYIPALVKTYPSLCGRLLTIASYSTGSGEIIRNLLTWLIATVTLIGAILFMFRLIGSLSQYLRRSSAG